MTEGLKEIQNNEYNINNSLNFRDLFRVANADGRIETKELLDLEESFDREEAEITSKNESEKEGLKEKIRSTLDNLWSKMLENGINITLENRERIFSYLEDKGYDLSAVENKEGEFSIKILPDILREGDPINRIVIEADDEYKGNNDSVEIDEEEAEDMERELEKERIKEIHNDMMDNLNNPLSEIGGGDMEGTIKLLNSLVAQMHKISFDLSKNENYETRVYFIEDFKTQGQSFNYYDGSGKKLYNALEDGFKERKNEGGEDNPLSEAVTEVSIPKGFSYGDIPDLLKLIQGAYKQFYQRLDILTPEKKELLGVKTALDFINIFDSIKKIAEKYKNKAIESINKVSYYEKQLEGESDEMNKSSLVKIKDIWEKRAYYYYYHYRKFSIDSEDDNLDNIADEYIDFKKENKNEEANKTPIEIYKTGPFSKIAQEFLLIDENERIEYDDLTLFSEGIMEQYEKYISEDKLDDFYKCFYIPKREKKEFTSEHIKRSIGYIATNLDKFLEKDPEIIEKGGNPNVLEYSLKKEQKLELTDILIDSLEVSSRRERIREGDLLEIIEQNFSKEKMINLKKYYLESFGIELNINESELFDNINEARKNLEKIRKGVDSGHNSIEDLREIEKKISNIISVIVYSERFFTYQNSFGSKKITGLRIGNCVQQGEIVSMSLKALFGINTRGVYILGEDYGHFITTLEDGYRTDWGSTFNTQDEKYMDISNENIGKIYTISNDPISIRIYANYLHLEYYGGDGNIHYSNISKYQVSSNTRYIGITPENDDNKKEHIFSQWEYNSMPENMPKSSKAYIVYNFGADLINNGEKEKSLEKYKEALDLFKELSEKEEYILEIIEITSIIYKLEGTDEYKEECIEYSKKLIDTDLNEFIKLLFEVIIYNFPDILDYIDIDGDKVIEAIEKEYGENDHKKYDISFDLARKYHKNGDKEKSLKFIQIYIHHKYSKMVEDGVIPIDVNNEEKLKEKLASYLSIASAYSLQYKISRDNECKENAINYIENLFGHLENNFDKVKKY